MSGCGSKEQPSVRVTTPLVATIKADFLATGKTAASEIEVGSEYWGPLEEVLVKTDDFVKKGQVLAIVSDVEGQEQLASLQNQLAVQRSVRDETLANIALRRTQLKIERNRREAERRRSRAEYAEAVAGIPPEKLAQAEADVDEAVAQLRQSRRERERLEQLFADDIASQAQVEKAQMEEEISLARRTRAMKRVEELKKGATREAKASAEAELAVSEANLQSERESDMELSILEQQLQTKTLNLMRLEDELRSMKNRLSRSRIVSPVDGQVIIVHHQPGEVLHRGTPVATILDPTDLWVEAEVAEEDSGHVFAGQEVIVRFPSLGPKSFAGRIQSVAATLRTPRGAQGNARFLQVKVKLLAEPENLKPGIEADVEGSSVLAEEVLTVPLQAIIREGGDTFLVTANDSKTRRLQVQVGVSDGERVEVKGDVTEADLVVIDQPSRFDDNVTVTVQR